MLDVGHYKSPKAPPARASATTRIDLTGRRFGRLVVRTYVGGRKWSCVCDCGANHDARSSHLRKGRIKSCGCLARELTGARFRTHGMSGTPEYRGWKAMKRRCFNPHHVAYKYYGGEGITVCDEWLSFEPYFADTGSRPPGCSLDRIDPRGHYEPGNVRWADAKQQRQNQRPQRARSAVKRRQVEPLPLNDPPF